MMSSYNFSTAAIESSLPCTLSPTPTPTPQKKKKKKHYDQQLCTHVSDTHNNDKSRNSYLAKIAFKSSKFIKYISRTNMLNPMKYLSVSSSRDMFS